MIWWCWGQARAAAQLQLLFTQYTVQIKQGHDTEGVQGYAGSYLPKKPLSALVPAQEPIFFFSREVLSSLQYTKALRHMMVYEWCMNLFMHYWVVVLGL